MRLMRKELRRAMSWTRDEERRQHPPDKPYCARYPTVSQRLWPRFDNYLRARDLDVSLARANFWFPSRTVDGYDRIVVPATSDQPGNLYWQARLIQAVTLGNAKPTDPRRWESPHGIARGNAVCVVWPLALHRNGKAVVVEGPMDALAAAGEGYTGVALMGVTPAAEVLDLTSRLLHGIMCVSIMDMGAEAEMADNTQYLAHRGLPCKLVNPYPHKDLATMAKVQRATFLKEAFGE